MTDNIALSHTDNFTDIHAKLMFFILFIMYFVNIVDYLRLRSPEKITLSVPEISPISTVFGVPSLYFHSERSAINHFH